MINKLKWIAGLAWLLFLGGIGSGLWEIFLRPVFYWCGGAILSITTLGLLSLKDNLYVSVANEQHEHGAILLLGLLISGLLGVAAGMFSSKLRRKKIVNTASDEDEAEPPTARMNWFGRRQVAQFMVGLVLVIYLGTIYKESYVAGATAYLLQLQRIAAPYVTQDQRLFRAYPVNADTHYM